VAAGDRDRHADARGARATRDPFRDRGAAPDCAREGTRTRTLDRDVRVDARHAPALRRDTRSRATSRCSPTTARWRGRSRSRARSTTAARSASAWRTSCSRRRMGRWCISRRTARATGTTTRTARWRSPPSGSRLERRACRRRPTASTSRSDPPRGNARSRERTSWSCAHGVERWRAACGCALQPGTSQAWRAPLRAAADHFWSALRDAFPAELEPLLLDWIDAHLGREPAQALFARHGVEETPRTRLAIETAWLAQRASRAAMVLRRPRRPERPSRSFATWLGAPSCSSAGRRGPEGAPAPHDPRRREGGRRDERRRPSSIA
jgi:hypothetical protein